MIEQALPDPTGDELLALLSALASAQRLRVLASLAGERRHVSELARQLKMSRPLLYLHLQRLESAGLLTSKLELSPDGRALKFFEVVPFAIQLTPELITEAVNTLTQTTTSEGSQET
jgi:DNA-binding transcriptional ArsR family regulator